MTTESGWFPSHVRELGRAECLELLAAHEVGRVAYCDEAGPVVLPVNYALDGSDILIKVSPHSALAQHLRDASASFQIDDFESYTQSGWSVLVRGTASHVEPTEVPADTRAVPWAEGVRTLHVRIAAREVTGRRLLPA